MICFCLIIRFSVFFQCFLLSFLFPVCFYIFHLAKLLLALDTLIFIPVNWNFFSNLGSDHSFHYCGAYQLISLPNLPDSATNYLFHSSLALSYSATNILYPSSLALSFSSVHSWGTWCDKTMVFLSL